MNKKDILNKIKSLEGLNQDERAYLVNLVNTKKKYGLVWEDKPEDVEEQLRTKLPVLQEVKERAIINDNVIASNEAVTLSVNTERSRSAVEESNNDRSLSGVEVPNHILIEGDNLHALTALTFTHENKIDLIYIDPPYNTGKKDEFKYNDKFVDKEDTYRHSKWLSFISKRLEIAKLLLKEDGLILISIDDNEIAQLKLLGNEIFGERNFVGQWQWYKSATPPNLSHKIRKNLEYIVGWEKIKNSTKYEGAQKFSKSDDPLTKPQNTIKELKFPIGSIEFKIENEVIEPGVYGTTKYPNELLNQIKIENYTNATEVIFRNRFVWTQPKLEEELEKHTKIKCSKTLVPSYKKSNYDKEVPLNLIDESVGVDTTEEAGKYLYSVFGKKVFDYPKPVSLLKYLIQFKKSELILDFFAGSGTTLEAIMELNKEKEQKRQGILVTNNENNIAEEVTYERNKRVIQGYTNAKGEQVEGLKNNNLRYYKTAFVDREPSLQNKRQLTQLATELLCIKEDCYTEVQHQLSINPKQGQIFTNNKGKYLVAIYHSRNQLQVQEQLISWVESLTNTTEKVRLYAFSPEKEVLAEEFYEVTDKVEVVPLPEAIYNAYLSTIKALKLDKKQVYNNNTAEA